MHDISAYNWNMVYNKGELQYLNKELAYTAPEEMFKHHTSVYDSYIKEFGLSEETLQELETKRKAHDLYVKFLDTKDFRFKRQADLMIAKLNKKNESVSDGENKEDSFSYQITLVGKYYGKPVNPKEISAFNFFAAIKTMVEDASK